ncbi:MAG: hypothetical protein IJR52_10910 [Selenomonadaceae bacterium]|nr:hypothetical protein [Selenomonadaceae bacterium]MBQ9498066.1 hypothetical protein [Selenomonadaceae bacterium]
MDDCERKPFEESLIEAFKEIKDFGDLDFLSLEEKKLAFRYQLSAFREIFADS